MTGNKNSDRRGRRPHRSSRRTEDGRTDPRDRIGRERDGQDRHASRHRRALTVLMIVSRLLPVAVQAMLVVTALLARSWILAVMSATGLAMSIATAAQSLLTLRLRGGRPADPLSVAGTGRTDDAAGPSSDRYPPVSETGTIDARQASSCDIESVRLARILTAGNLLTPRTVSGPQTASGTLAAAATPAGSDPQTASDPQIAGMANPSDVLLWKRCVRSWYARRQETGTLRVPIGTGADGRACMLDLVHDGPHALVAGTTGSGKSVLLEAWCSALALTYPPSRLNFVFLDFKGGATFRDLRHLPHTAGSVSDLSLRLARRALDGLEHELRRREHLLSGQGVDRLDRLETPPPRLVVVVDEFNALRTSLPDYLPRLARIASQGRSLGIHLILATQSPSIEVPRSIQANIGTDICLRVRDPLQSSDLVGTRAAAWLPPDRPGTAIVRSGGGQLLFRAARPPSRCIDICALAGRFSSSSAGCGHVTARRLFTDPLPRVCHPMNIRRTDISRPDIPGTDITLSNNTGKTRRHGMPVAIGLADDGVMTFPAVIDPSRGNIAVCGPPGRGKSTLCRLVHRRAPSVMAVEEADGLLDPLTDTADARNLRRRLQNKDERTIYAVRDPRLVRYPSQCAIRVFFPTGDKAADMLAGIPAQALTGWEQEDLSCPGRALVCDGAGWTTVQIIAPDEGPD